MPYFALQDMTKLYYEEQGKGQPVLMVHGWSGSHESMADVVDILKDRCRCITYDHRGHGVSDKPMGGYSIEQLARDLHELVCYLDLQDFVLAGHSMGGQVVLSYVEQFGCERLSKLMIWDMSPKLLTEGDWNKGLRATYTREDLLGDLNLMAQDFSEYLWHFRRMTTPEVAALPESAKELVKPGLVAGLYPPALSALWVTMCTSDFCPMLDKITVPLGYIYPDSGIYPYATAEYFRDHVPAPTTIFTIKNAPHSMQKYCPEETAQAVLEMMKK